jgi:predicted membrane channel-forming protein YqfA (hemolysin III family)
VLYSTEVAFPVDQASAAGYLMAISQTFGFLTGILYANLLDGTRSTARMLLYVTVGCLFISVIVSISIKEDLRKTRFE